MTRSKNAATAGMSRLDRARVVRDLVLSQSAEHGQWETVQVGAAANGRNCRLWTIDAGLGWSASVTTPFTSPAATLRDADRYDAAMLGLELPAVPDQTVDVYWDAFGKVLSISRTGGEDRLIGFTTGLWEMAFGLPERPWPQSATLRLQRWAS